jgi:hypothetical protein
MPANSPPGWLKQYSRAVIEISQTYKEPDPPKRTIAVVVERSMPEASSAYAIFRTGDTVLLFLRASPAGDYGLADPFLGATHFRFVPILPSEIGLVKLQDALAQIAVNGEEQDQLHALQVLSGFDSLTGGNLARVRQVSSSTNPVLALTAFDALLTSKSVQNLGAFSAYLSEYKGSAEPLALSNIANRLTDFRDTESLPWIKNLAESRFVSIRTGAMRSLRARKDLRTVDVLVARLDDSDPTIQYLAVIALAETLNKYDGDYAPSMYLFDKRRAFYTTLWKQWWEDEGRSVYSIPKPD